MAEAAEADLYPILWPTGTKKRDLKPSWITGTSLHIQGPAHSLSLKDLKNGLYNYTGETETSGDGEHWIVIAGHKPGIYNSWYVCAVN